MSSVAARLKQLRLRTNLSVRKFAAAIGIDHSRYAYFEDEKRFNKPFLEMGLAREVARVVSDFGVDPAEALHLAGIEPGEPVGLDLSPQRKRLLESFDDLTPDQQRLIQQLVDEMREGSSPPAPRREKRPAVTLHDVRPAYQRADGEHV